MDFEVLTCAIRPYATILTFNKWYKTQKYDYLDINTFLLLHIFPENSIKCVYPDQN